jgi:hypothetical protein
MGQHAGPAQVDAEAIVHYMMYTGHSRPGCVFFGFQGEFSEKNFHPEKEILF